MRFRILCRMLMAAAVAACFSPRSVFAEYDSSGKGRTAAQRSDGFDQAVDLDKFRKGNPDWDTQELIASGFREIHQENIKILQELRDLKSVVGGLQISRGSQTESAPASPPPASTKPQGRWSGYKR